jgi:hypothetical protein
LNGVTDERAIYETESYLNILKSETCISKVIHMDNKIDNIKSDYAKIVSDALTERKADLNSCYQNTLLKEIADKYENIFKSMKSIMNSESNPNDISLINGGYHNLMVKIFGGKSIEGDKVRRFCCIDMLVDHDFVVKVFGEKYFQDTLSNVLHIKDGLYLLKGIIISFNKHQLEHYLNMKVKMFNLGVLVTAKYEGKDKKDEYFRNVLSIINIKQTTTKINKMFRFMFQHGISNYGMVFEYLERINKVKPQSIVDEYYLRLIFKFINNLVNLVHEEKEIVDEEDEIHRYKTVTNLISIYNDKPVSKQWGVEQLFMFHFGIKDRDNKEMRVAQSLQSTVKLLSELRSNENKEKSHKEKSFVAGLRELDDNEYGSKFFDFLKKS